MGQAERGDVAAALATAEFVEQCVRPAASSKINSRYVEIIGALRTTLRDSRPAGGK